MYACIEKGVGNQGEEAEQQCFQEAEVGKKHVFRQCIQLYLPSHNLDKTKLKAYGKVSMVYQYLCSLAFIKQLSPMQIVELHKGNIAFCTSCFKSHVPKLRFQEYTNLFKFLFYLESCHSQGLNSKSPASVMVCGTYCLY